ncbi:MAG: hypothetical protein HZB51_09990 [Chloroflexi bacterium]|nr:hypothetical protein [Chloroflexota bacterium]
MANRSPQHDQPLSDHEPRDLNVRGILIFFAGLGGMMTIALLVVTVTLMLGSTRGMNLKIPPSDLTNAPAPTLPAEPRLEAIPGLQLQELRAIENKRLNTYGWIDQKAGIVHIPIERAMDLLIQRGLPVRPDADSKFQDSGNQSPSDPSSGRIKEKYP